MTTNQQQINALIFSTKPLKEMYPALKMSEEPLVGLEEWSTKVDALVNKTIHVHHLCDLQEITMAKLADEKVTPHTMALFLEWVEHNLMHYGLMKKSECIVTEVEDEAEVEIHPAFVSEVKDSLTGEEWLATRPEPWNERDRAILEYRILERDAKKWLTLEGLAKQYEDISRERIRQLEKEIEDFLRWMAGDAGIPACRKMTQEVRLMLGAGLPLAEAEEKLRQIAPHDPIAVACAAYAAGPYVTKNAHDGWLLCDGIKFPVAADFLDAGEWRIAEDRLNAALVGLGFLPTAIDHWINSHPKMRHINGQRVFIGSKMSDVAVAIIGAYGKSIDEDRLMQEYGTIAGEQLSNRNSFIGTFKANFRLMRVTKDKWALAAWEGEHYERYESISDCIVRVLGENEGACTLKKLEEECQRRWEVLPSSLRNMVATLQFSQENGVVRVRTGGYGDIQVSSDVSKRKGLFAWQDGTALSWCHCISLENQRGTSQQIPKELAGWLKLRPDEEVKAISPMGEVKFSWNPVGNNGPIISSIKALCEHAGAAEGKWSVFKFQRNGQGLLEFTFSLCGDDIASNFGLPADMSKEEIRRQLAVALKVQPGEELQALRLRGEEELAEMF